MAKKKSSTKAGKAPTKSEVYAQVAEASGLSKKEVAAAFDALGGVIKKSLRAGGVFTVPGLCKMVVRKKPGTKGGEKKINAFTGKEYITKPKPASKAVRIRPLKALKEML